MSVTRSKPLFAGRYLRWVEIRDNSHAFVNVELDPRSDSEYRREWCSYPWTDEQLLDEAFGLERPP